MQSMIAVTESYKCLLLPIQWVKLWIPSTACCKIATYGQNSAAATTTSVVVDIFLVNMNPLIVNDAWRKWEHFGYQKPTTPPPQPNPSKLSELLPKEPYDRLWRNFLGPRIKWALCTSPSYPPLSSAMQIARELCFRLEEELRKWLCLRLKRGVIYMHDRLGFYPVN